MIKTALFKISGKILDNSKFLVNTIAQLTQLFEDNIIENIIIIPGGGRLANLIRNLYYEFNLDDELAHWMAIYAMDFNGLELSKKFPHLNKIKKFSDLDKEAKKKISIFLPYKYLKKDNKLPHKWNVTSDSIALYLASQFNLNECYLIKDVDGILDSDLKLIKKMTTSQFIELKNKGNLAEVKSKELELKINSKPIDSYILTLIEECYIPCVILNGTSPEARIFKYFKSSNPDKEIFTKIYSN
jgi:aspartokinase-like uncharacterized kinase